MKRFRKLVLTLGTIAACIQAACGQFVINEPAPTRTHTVTGTVFDSSGAPAVGVVMDTVSASALKKPLILTDSNGTYSIDWQTRSAGSRLVTNLVIARDLKRNLVATHAIDEGTSNVDLHLQPGLSISFKVQDPAGNPISNAVARLIAVYGNASMLISNQSPETGATDQNRIMFDTLPPNFHFNGSVRAPGYGAAQLRLPAEPGTNSVDLGVITLKVANLKVAGRVLGTDGKPAGAVRIALTGEGQSTSGIQTDEEGRFSFDVSEGTANLFASQSIDGVIKTGQAHTIGGDTNVEIKLALQNVPAVQPVVVAAQPVIVQGWANNPTAARTQAITGSVLDPSGAPAVGVEMNALLPNFGGVRQPVLTDTHGKYLLEWVVPPANPRAAVTDSLLARDVKHNLVATHLMDEGTSNLDLRLEPGLTISFKVEDPAGNPISNAVAQLSMSYANAGLAISSQLQGDKAQEPNRIEFNALPQGYHYNCNVRAVGYGMAILRFPVDTHTNRIDLGVVTLKPANLKLAGRIVDPDGKALDKVMVTMLAPGQIWIASQSDEDGRFAFGDCVEGPVNLNSSVILPDGQRLTGTVRTVGGDTNVEIKLAPAKTTPSQPAPPVNRTTTPLLPGG
jgi:hypothetical protein